jgi:hypothetical protein
MVIDASEVAEFAVDLGPGGLRGMRNEQPGLREAINEISSSQAECGEQAGINAADIRELETARERIALIDKFLQPSKKMVEKLTETRATLVDECERKISAIAANIETRAKGKGNKSLLATYQTTLAYRSAAALKGVHTRQRNAKANDESKQGG